jgi:hypothetical protein
LTGSNAGYSCTWRHAPVGRTGAIGVVLYHIHKTPARFDTLTVSTRLVVLNAKPCRLSSLYLLYPSLQRHIQPMDASLGDANDLASSQLHLLGEETLARQDHDTEHAYCTLTLWNAFSLLVLTQIGAGLFASPTAVDANVPSLGLALFAWLFACIIGWTGAASFADLAFLFLNGGMEDYLHRFYGDTLSFLMAWTWITVVKPSSMAMVSTVLLESILAGVDSNVAPSAKRLFTMLAFFVIVAINLHSTQTSKRVSNFFLVIKLTTVAIIVVFGFSAALLWRASPFTDWLTKPWLETRPSIIGEDQIDWARLNWWQVMGHFCTALYAVLWACSGWDNVGFTHWTTLP